MNEKETKTILVSEGPAEDFATYEPGTVETAREDAEDGRMANNAKEAQEEWNPNPEQLLQLMSRKSQR